MDEAGENKTVRLHMLMSPSEAEAIDDWGFARRIRTRAEAVRRLFATGLAFGSPRRVVDGADSLDLGLNRALQAFDYLTAMAKETGSVELSNHLKDLKAGLDEARQGQAATVAVLVDLANASRNEKLAADLKEGIVARNGRLSETPPERGDD